jgi:hypothetical protein
MGARAENGEDVSCAFFVGLGGSQMAFLALTSLQHRRSSKHCLCLQFPALVACRNARRTIVSVLVH